MKVTVCTSSSLECNHSYKWSWSVLLVAATSVIATTVPQLSLHHSEQL